MIIIKFYLEIQTKEKNHYKDVKIKIHSQNKENIFNIISQCFNSCITIIYVTYKTESALFFFFSFFKEIYFK